VHETTDSTRHARANQVLDASDVRVVRGLAVGVGGGLSAEERKVGGRVEHRIDALTNLQHPVGIFDFGSDDLELRVLELEGGVSDDGADRVTLVEKASNQMAAEEPGSAGH
jgi:hypothetical protein